jgi:Mce-associated membrane protein
MAVASSRPSNSEVNERTGTGGRRRIVRLLSVVTVLGVLIGVGGLLLPQVFSHSRSGTVGDRKDVVARTTDFAVAYNTYDVAQVADYQERMKGLLTTSYDKEFVKVTNSIFKALVVKKQVSSNAKVLGVAVDSIDKDSAVALVAVDSSISNTDAKAAVPRHLRWKVEFIKQKGQWRVDKFESVATLSASTGEPSAVPSTQPTEGSTPK